MRRYLSPPAGKRGHATKIRVLAVSFVAVSTGAGAGVFRRGRDPTPDRRALQLTKWSGFSHLRNTAEGVAQGVCRHIQSASPMGVAQSPFPPELPGGSPPAYRGTRGWWCCATATRLNAIGVPSRMLDVPQCHHAGEDYCQRSLSANRAGAPARLLLHQRLPPRELATLDEVVSRSRQSIGDT